MDYWNSLVLVGSALVLVSIIASTVSSRLGAPILLIFLLLGMLAGEDGPGGIQFNDVGMSFLVGNVALAVILFDGGLRTRYETFRIGLWPAVSLASVGVLITSGLVGVIASYVLNLSLLQGLLIGAIIGSTDAAAVFSVLHSHGVSLKQRVASVLEIESGSNDPMAIFLTVLLIGALTAGKVSLSAWDLVSELGKQFGIGTVLGYLGGRLVALLVNRVAVAPAFYPLLVGAGGLLVYSVAAVLGGSGFLAIYIAGLVIGNSQLNSAQNILTVHHGLAWLSQITMFLILGLLVTPSQIPAIAWGATLIALGLTFVARPLAVAVCLAPFRFPWRENVFIAWVGLRGAVPIILSLFPLMAGLDDSRYFFNTAFIVVILSLVVQGWTIAPVARLLKLEVPPAGEPASRVSLAAPRRPEHELLGYRVAPACLAAGRRVAELGLPERARVWAIAREEGMIALSGDVTIAAGDYVYIAATAGELPRINALFDPHVAPRGLDEQRFFGYFSLDGEAPLADIEAMYGFEFQNKRPEDVTIHDYLTRRFHRRPVVGDRIRVSGCEFVVREMNRDRIRKVGFLGCGL